MSPSDQTPDISSGDQPPAAAPPERAPPSEQTLRESRRRVRNLVDLITYAIDDPARTRRLVVLIATSGGCLALVIFVLGPQSERLAYAAAAVSSVLTSAVAARRWRNAASSRPGRRRRRR